MIRLILIRHGESTADLDPIRIEGQADFPLSPKGAEQAKALGLRICREYPLIDLISSPLRRAYQTAQAIAHVCDLPVSTDPRLMERSDGVFGGMTGLEAQQQYPDHKMPWNLLAHEAPPDGESFLQQHLRVAEFWHSIYHGSDDRTLGVVAHGGTITILYQLALGLPLRNRSVFSTNDTGVHHWEFDPGGEIRVRFANCTRHLE